MIYNEFHSRRRKFEKKALYQLLEYQQETNWKIFLSTGPSIKLRRCKGQRLADNVAVYMAEARKERCGIVWRLYTTHPVNSLQDVNTEKLSSPRPPTILKWATWVIAELSGWKGYGLQRRPGPIVLQNGLVKFYAILQRWKLYQIFLKNVSTVHTVTQQEGAHPGYILLRSLKLPSRWEGERGLYYFTSVMHNSTSSLVS